MVGDTVMQGLAGWGERMDKRLERIFLIIQGGQSATWGSALMP